MPVYIALIIVLLMLSAFFSCSETALFSLSRSEVAQFKSASGILGRKVIEVLSNPRRLLVSILLGNELVNVAIAIFVASTIYFLAVDLTWQMRLVLSVAISTPLIIVIGEVIPKNIGIRFASVLAPACAVFINFFSNITSPFVKFLLTLADQVILLFGGNPNNIRSMIMEEEFRQMVEIGYEEGSIGEAEGELIHRVFDLGDKTVEEIMTPQEGIFALSLDTEIEEALMRIRTTQFSRIPIYDAGPDDIVGVLHTRDLFSALRQRKAKNIREMEEIIRPACFAPKTATLENTLREFQLLKMHLAIIIDKRHKPIGIVTMDDIFGALFKDE